MNKNCTGSTMIEVIMAMALITFLLLSLMATYSIGTQVNLTSQKRVNAQAIAREYMEETLQLNFDAIEAILNGTPPQGEAANGQGIVRQGITLTRTISWVDLSLRQVEIIATKNNDANFRLRFVRLVANR